MSRFNGNWTVQTIRHLITGGMFSAEQRISMNEEVENERKTLEQEAKILPNITFYTREFEPKEEAALEHIPLYENGRWRKPKN